MTKSNRDAAKDGELGGNVLDLAMSTRRATIEVTEPRTDSLGWNPAPGLVSALLGARGEAARDEARASIGIDEAVTGSDRTGVVVVGAGLAAEPRKEWTAADVQALMTDCESEDPAVRLAAAMTMRAAVEAGGARVVRHLKADMARVNAAGGYVTREDVERLAAWPGVTAETVNAVLAKANDEAAESIARRWPGVRCNLGANTRRILDGCSVATATSEQLRDLANVLGLDEGERPTDTPLPLTLDRSVSSLAIIIANEGVPVFVQVHTPRDRELRAGDVPWFVSLAVRSIHDFWMDNTTQRPRPPTHIRFDFDVNPIPTGSRIVASTTLSFYTPLDEGHKVTALARLGGCAVVCDHAATSATTTSEWIALYVEASQTEPRPNVDGEVQVLLMNQPNPRDNGAWTVRPDGSHQRPAEAFREDPSMWSTSAMVHAAVTSDLTAKMSRTILGDEDPGRPGVDDGARVWAEMLATERWPDEQAAKVRRYAEQVSRAGGGSVEEVEVAYRELARDFHERLKLPTERKHAGEVLRTIATPEQADAMFGAGSEMAGRVRGLLALWGGSIDVDVPMGEPYTFKPAPEIERASPVPGASFNGIPFPKHALPLLLKPFSTREWLVTRESLAPRPARGPTFRAECSASDVTEGTQDRTTSPPDADHGPAFTPGPGPAVAAMIADGWILRD